MMMTESRTNLVKSRSSSRSEDRKRKYFDNEFEGIPKNVREWEIYDLDPIGIFYNNTFETNPTRMFDVLAKNQLNFGDILSIKQTLESLKSKLSFDIPSLDLLPRQSMTFANEIINKIYRNSASIRESVSTENCLLNMALSNAFDFTQRIAFMVERLYREKPTSEHIYSAVVGALARMSLMQDEYGNVYRNEMYINGVNVVSKPDLRLKRTLLSSSEDQLSQQVCQLVVSVMEDKGNSAKPLSKQQSRSEMQNREANINTGIHNLSFLDASVLGRHGGELLLEWEDSLFNPYIPGMIVCGTKVVMTLLHIKKEHVDKLKNNWNLVTDEDKATIVYSKPLDILIKEERDILLEMLFQINFTNRKFSDSNT